MVTVVPLVQGSPGADGFSTAVAALRGGSAVAVPTDTVYGLAVVPFLPDAVEGLFSVKERPREVPLPVLVTDWDQVDAVAGRLTGEAELLAVRYWPGPLTLVVPRSSGFAVDLGGPPSARVTVGVRWPRHPVVERLCRELGPLAVTSANRHGSPPATTAGEVAKEFSGAVELAVVLDGGTCDGTPSTVIECRGPATRCLREGSIPWDEIGETLVAGLSPGGSPPGVPTSEGRSRRER